MSFTYRARRWWDPPAPQQPRLTPQPLEPLCAPMPRTLPESNESVRAIRALEAQIRPKETP